MLSPCDGLSNVDKGDIDDDPIIPINNGNDMIIGAPIVEPAPPDR